MDTNIQEILDKVAKGMTTQQDADELRQYIEDKEEILKRIATGMTTEEDYNLLRSYLIRRTWSPR